MAWNEPNGHDKKNDPWNNKHSKTPPDLDEALKKLKKKLHSLFYRKNNRPGGNGELPGNNSIIAGLIVIIILVIWGIAGVFIVAPAEQAVILRFGKYVKLVGPGPHWRAPLIETKISQNTDKIISYSYSDKILTKDENIVSVSVVVKYRIKHLPEYLFHTADPEESVQQATASAMQQVVGNLTFNQILAEGRDLWAEKVTAIVTKMVAQYKVGIVIVGVSPEAALAPKEVRDAFDDAINAREDAKRFKQQAYAYEAKVVPTALGKAKRITEEAIADSEQVVLKAKGEVAEFLELLPEYTKAPELMRQRLYIETMQKVYTETNKIIVDTKTGNVINLPLEQLFAATKPKSSTSESTESTQNTSNTPTETTPLVTRRTSSRSESERSSYRGPRGQ